MGHIARWGPSQVAQAYLRHLGSPGGKARISMPSSSGHCYCILPQPCIPALTQLLEEPWAPFLRVSANAVILALRMSQCSPDFPAHTVFLCSNHRWEP